MGACACCNLRTNSIIVASIFMVGSLVLTMVFIWFMNLRLEVDRRWSENRKLRQEYTELIMSLIFYAVSCIFAVVLLVGAIERNSLKAKIWGFGVCLLLVFRLVVLMVTGMTGIDDGEYDTYFYGLYWRHKMNPVWVMYQVLVLGFHVYSFIVVTIFVKELSSHKNHGHVYPAMTAIANANGGGDGGRDFGLGLVGHEMSKLA